jgi:putative hemolysin
VTEAAHSLLQALRDAPPVRVRQGRYELRFARAQEELDEILHLRFNVFNLELGEGLESSFLTRRDEDAFDRTCHHLLVEDLACGRIVGTYRMQTAEMAQRAAGFYSAGEFTLESLPREILAGSVELGRACIERGHRGRAVLFLLWKGLAAYLMHFGKRYLFGCCSLSTQDRAAGHALHQRLGVEGRVHPELAVVPRAGYECGAEDCAAVAIVGGAPGVVAIHGAVRGASAGTVELPQLFATYLRYGALVCGPPAIDREFKTIDWFVLLDTNALDPRTFRSFFAAER